MKPIDFPEKTHDIAKDQEQYLTLPAYVDELETVSCWKLTWLERLKLLLTGRLWLRQLNFGRALQPQCPSVDRPLMDTAVDEPQPEPR